MSAPRLNSIEVYYSTGLISRFAFADPGNCQDVVDQLKTANSFYTRSLVLLSTRFGLTALQTANVARLDFFGFDLPIADYLNSVTSIVQVSEQSFRALFDPSSMAEERRRAWQVPGEDQEGFVEFEIAGSQSVYWRVNMQSQRLTAADLPTYIGGLLQSGGLHAELEYGQGISIINPRHILTASFYPGPPIVPPGTWDVSATI